MQVTRKMKYKTFREKLEKSGVIEKPEKKWTEPELYVLTHARKLGERFTRLSKLIEMKAPKIIIEDCEELIKTALDYFTHELYTHKTSKGEKKIWTSSGKSNIQAERLYEKYKRSKKK